MARLARVVIPGLPHHFTQRRNRRQQTFFHDGDYAAYVERMAEWCREEGVAIWAYYLMPNHVHLIAGCGAVWVVDPATRTVAVYDSQNRMITRTTSDELTGDEVVPDFRLPVAEIFAS